MATELGVYAGPGTKGVAGALAFATATGAPVARRTEFLPYETWAQLATSGWVLEAHAGTGLTLDLRVPLMTKEGKAAGETLDDVAAGRHDDVFQRIADYLAAHPEAPITVALGWEFNGGWYPWTAWNAAAFVAAYQRVWSIIVTTPGTGHVTFVWCVANGRYSALLEPEGAWPGDRCVDAVGVDFYDYSWLYKRDGTDKAVRDRAWDLLTTGDHGLRWWAGFAAERRRPLAIPEWGPGIRADGGGDNPDFVHRALTEFVTLDVAWANYFEAGDTTVEHRLATPDTRLPLAAEAFRARMSAWTPTAAPGER